MRASACIIGPGSTKGSTAMHRPAWVSFLLAACATAALVPCAMAQETAAAPPPAGNSTLYAIGSAPSSARIEADIRKLVSFGTRHTLSDTKSDTRGIGAARRWIRAEFERISADCGGCLEDRKSTRLN